MRHTRLSLVLIALALVVAACNQDSDDTTTTAASTPSETTTTEATTTITTTEAVTTTTTAVGGLEGLPDFNPESVVLQSYTSIDLAPYSGLNRCAWLSQDAADYQGQCETMAGSQHDYLAIARDSTADDAPTSLRGFGGNSGDPADWVDPDHPCFIDADELVTPATANDVIAHVPEAVQVKDEEEVEVVLSGGLYVYAVHDPIAATSALVDAGIPASPRYVLVPSPIWQFGPGGPALPADPAVVNMQGTLPPPPDTEPSDTEEWSPPTIFVIDTGSNAPGSADPEPSDLNSAFRGHGQFIAGIIKRLLPPATVQHLSALETIGNEPPVVDENSVVAAIDKAIQQLPEFGEGAVFNLSVGTYACRPDNVPLELAARLGEMVEGELDIAVVAAAGNDSHEAATEGDSPESGDPPFWPAGFSDPALIEAVLGEDLAILDSYPTLKGAISALHSATNVIGVGALVHNAGADAWLPAEFSNQVAATVWAPGANIVSNHPDWASFAQWDGTSFAAPHVSALIASCADPDVEGGYLQALAQVRSTGNCLP